MSLDQCLAIVESHFKSSGFSDSEIQEYLKILRAKWDKIEDVIRGENVRKYCFLPSGMELWIVRGKTSEYLIRPLHYCSCTAFYFNTLIKKNEKCCYHILAFIICRQLNNFTTIYKEDTVYFDYLSDFVNS